MKEKEQTEYFFNYLFNEEIENLVQLNNDPPDFEFHYQGKITSLEHTRYFNLGGERIKAKKSLQNNIIEKTFELYNQRKLQPLAVGFVFEWNINLLKKEILPYCEELCDFIINNTPKDYNDDGAISIENNLPKFLKRLSIVKYTTEVSFWQQYGAYKVDDLDFEILDSIIQKKSDDIIRYSKKDYTNHWLLIVIEREEYSNYSGFDSTEYRDKFMSLNKFDRIYLATMMHRPKLIRIK